MNLVLVLEQRSSTTHTFLILCTTLCTVATCLSQWVYKMGPPILSPIFRLITKGDLKYHTLEMILLIRKRTSNNQFKDNVDYFFHLTTWSEQAHSFCTCTGSTDIIIQFASIQTEIRMIRHNPVKRIFQSLMSVNKREKM